MLGEEGGLSGDTASDYLWCVDPLDGTTNFARSYPSFAVSVGVLKRAVPVAASSSRVSGWGGGVGLGGEGGAEGREGGWRVGGRMHDGTHDEAASTRRHGWDPQDGLPVALKQACSSVCWR